jgi:hypothetical protein
VRALLALLFSLACGIAVAQPVPDRTPEDLIGFIYKQYVGKKPDDAIFRWTEKAMADRLFEPTLARGLIRALNSPANREGPVIDFDPFVDGQDFEIKSYSLRPEQKGADKARIVAVFDNMGEPRRVAYDLVLTKAGWRIHDISWGKGRGSFRRILRIR